MSGWAVQEVVASNVTVAGVVANSPLHADGFRITAGGATKGLVIKITSAAVTVAGSITAKLQTAIGADWVDAKTAAIAANGVVYIKIMDIADYAVMPLLAKGRIVVTNTNASDTVTVSKVEVLQEL